RLILEIEAALSPGEQPTELGRVELVDELGASMDVDLLACGDGRRGRVLRGVRGRALIRYGVDDVDGAFAHRHHHTARPQIDVECGTDGAHPGVAGAHPERPLRIMGHLEEGFAALETNDPAALAVVDR